MEINVCIKIKIDGTEFELSRDDAEKLQNELNSALNKPIQFSSTDWRIYCANGDTTWKTLRLTSEGTC